MNLFFLLSGEHPSLPAAELRAILEAFRIEYDAISRSFRLLTISASDSALRAVAGRALMCKAGGLSLFDCPADRGAISDSMRDLNLDDFFSEPHTFCVRVVRLAGAGKQIEIAELDRDLGDAIRIRWAGSTVDLGAPHHSFLGILHGEKFLLGLLKYDRPKGSASGRLPRARPVFHSSTLPPKLARCMVNLSRAEAGAMVLDPFCGTGGILLEAAEIGCEVAGCDADEEMVRGAKLNLKFFGHEADRLVVADARRLAFKKADSIVTDPPYGKGASVFGGSAPIVFGDFLRGAYEALRDRGHIALAAPVEFRIGEAASEYGFNSLESHVVRVHKSLSREILVLRK